MAKVQQTSFSPSMAGTTVTLSAPNGIGSSNGDAIKPNAVVWVANANASPMTITVKTTVTIDGLTVPDRSVTVPATTTMLVGPFSNGNYTQASGTDAGFVYLEYSSVTSLTRAVINPSS